MKHAYSLVCAMVLLSVGCQAPASAPLPAPDHVDLERFMGDWYVVASIPTPFERGAHNAIERYTLADDGHIATEFTYNKDALDGPRKTMHAKGFVLDATTNARWGMQFIWPFKADYRIIYVDSTYNTTIVGRQQRDYVWIMSRSLMDDATIDGHADWLRDLGYDTSKLIRIPHSVNTGGPQ
ncbi:MAG: lipocalin family protein [Gammaproteobacteria bacterium]|nr:lipocalin family protein [Gammaproteobacteria bacterium]